MTLSGFHRLGVFAFLVWLGLWFGPRALLFATPDEAFDRVASLMVGLGSVAIVLRIWWVVAGFRDQRRGNADEGRSPLMHPASIDSTVPASPVVRPADRFSL